MKYSWLIGQFIVISAIGTMSKRATVAVDLDSEYCLAQGDTCKGGDDLQGRARYDFYRIYNVELNTEQQIELFQKLEQQSDSLTFIGHAREVGQKLSILVAAHRVADIDDLLRTYNVKHRILTKNFQEKIDSNMAEVKPIDTDPVDLDWHHYYHLETIYKWMAHMSEKYPKELNLIDMGSSTEGVPIKGLKLSRNPKNKAIFIESGIHAREWIAPASATFIINELLTSTDDSIKALANNYNWIVIPCVNPDGYKFTFEHDRMWRKNRQLYGTCRGVDLNRNYPDHWNSTGCSGDPCRYDFSGSAAASEIETQRLIEYIKANVKKEQIKTYIALHSYSQMIMYPYGYTKERVINYDDLKDFGQKAVDNIKAFSGRIYTSGSLIETIYPSSGDSMDWAYSEAGIPIAYTFELRGPPDSEDLFILPANEILPTAKEALIAIQTIVENAAKKGYYD